MFSLKRSCLKTVLVLIPALLTCVICFSQVKGTVTDARTGEPMTGATVTIKETGKKQFVQLDGNFNFKNIAPGNYELEISYTDYKPHTEQIVVVAGKTTEIKISLEARMVELSTVTIEAGNNGSEKNTRTLEKNSNQLVNIFSAKSIQLLPDITVANVLQRVSGVTIEKSGSGEARYPIIRGMEKRYINTLVNGIKIPSPDNKNRFIPLDLFPSELLERLEVSKSLTPSMEGDAIGGTINLVMKDAPQNKLLQVNAALGYNSILGHQSYQQFDKSSINKQSPAEINGPAYVATPQDFSVAHLNYTDKKSPINSTFGITFGNRLGKDKKIGFIVSGSYQDIFRGTTSNFFLPNSQPGLNNIPLFSDLQLRKYSVQSKRLGLNGKLDYQVNDRNKISLTNTFVRLDDYQTRIVYDTIALNSLVNNWQRSTWQYQTIYNSTLQGIHKLTSTLKIDWSLVYSMATNHIPDQSQFTHEYAIVATSLTADKVQGMDRLWSHNSDKDYAGYLDITKNLKILHNPFELKAGTLLRSKTRDNFYNSYSLDPVLGEVYTNINSAVFIFNPASSGIPVLNGNNYTFKENISAGYIQGKWQLTSKLEALG
ncbi:MAG: carboxypeptidase-like regulatory domain-containing protein, partial [Bacteroidota bacterium]|nr:carboxypeptidase-like regulatory domain-containing protein [Bacteroidota bacterium]